MYKIFSFSLFFKKITKREQRERTEREENRERREQREREEKRREEKRREEKRREEKREIFSIFGVRLFCCTQLLFSPLPLPLPLLNDHNRDRHQTLLFHFITK